MNFEPLRLAINHKIRYWKPQVHLMLVLLLSMLITGIAFSLQPNSLLEIAYLVAINPMLFVMNALPVLAIMLLFYFASSNAFTSSTIASTIVLLLSVINRYKIEFRDEPLVPMDLLLIKEANGMVTEGGFKISFVLVGAVILWILSQLVLAYFCRQKSYKWYTRLSGVGLCIGLLIIGNTSVYAKSVTYDSFKVVGNQYNVTKQFNARGFIYSFIYNSSAYKAEKPEGFNKGNVDKWIEAYSNKETVAALNASTKQPHVIMVMGEAFSDFTNQTDLKFSADHDPLKFYNQLIQKDNVISGQIVAPTFGGGTANTEYEALTGGANLYLNKSLTTAYTLIRKPMESLPSIMESLGYSSVGMHPGYSWFYNRQNVYRNFGFQETYFEDQFEQKKKGNYLAEDVTVDKMIEVFEAHQKKNQNPLFQFCVTIQNHGPYDLNQYGDDRVEFTSEKPLTEDTKKLLSTYLVGLRDADQQLERLINYYNAVNEPIVVVYFGDHLPYLGEDYKAYRELGYNLSPNGDVSQRLNNYKTPFFIWKNNAAAHLDFKSVQLPKNKTINAGYLAGLTLEVIGHKNASPFMAFLNEMRMILPVFRGSEYAYGDKDVDRLEPDSREVTYLKKLIHWQYYRIK